LTVQLRGKGGGLMVAGKNLQIIQAVKMPKLCTGPCHNWLNLGHHLKLHLLHPVEVRSAGTHLEAGKRQKGFVHQAAAVVAAD